MSRRTHVNLVEGGELQRAVALDWRAHVLADGI